MNDLLGVVLEACRRTPDGMALSQGRRSLTFGQLRQRILTTALSLEGLELAPGDRVLFSVRPGPAGIILALGIVAAGGTVVFADPGQGEALFRARAALAAPNWVAAESLLYVLSTGRLRRFARARGLELPDYRAIVPDARYLHAGARLPAVPRGSHSARELATARLARPPRGPAAPVPTESDLRVTDPAAPALVIFTSGTTEAPKAVVHSRATLGIGLADFASAIDLRPGERVVTDQLMVGIPALLAGCHWELPSAGLDPGARPSRMLALLPRADVLFLVPAALDALLTLLERHPTSAAPRAIILGGAPVLRPLLERARVRFPDTRIYAIYGMTELLPIAVADGDEKLERVGDGDYVGRLMPSVRARIDDGELVVSGPGLADYLDRPLTELRSGDLARLEGDELVLAGRAKDMFIRGTTNVYPGLYEPVIAGLPGVREAALVGVPNAVGDDDLVLALVLDGTTPERVREALPGLIDAAVLPDRVVRLDALPVRGRSRKLDRAALARLIAEEGS